MKMGWCSAQFSYSLEELLVCTQGISFLIVPRRLEDLAMKRLPIISMENRVLDLHVFVISYVMWAF
jgi:hypothetical protein